MYIDSSCPTLGIGTEISDVHVSSEIIDSNEGCCVAICTLLLVHITPRARDKLKKPTKEPFYAFSVDGTDEKVAVRFKAEKGQDSIYEITLCQ